jgi:MFS transporter, DHA1 family, multidrug resistance protein
MAAPEAAAAEGHGSWRRLAALFAIASVAETFGFGHFTAFTPLYLEQLGVASSDVPRWTGLLAAASFMLGLPLAPLWGVWADKYSRKLIIVRSALGEAVIFLVAALSQSVWHLLLARVLVGFILGNTGVMFAALAGVAPRHQLAFAIATVQTGSTLGQSLGPLVGGFLVGWLGIAGLFALDSILALGVAVLLLAGFREERQGPRDTRPVREMLLALPGALRAAPPVLPLYGVQFLLLLGVQMSTPFVPLLVGELHGGDDLPVAIGLVMTSFGVATALFTAVWGRLGDRLGRLRVLQVAVVLSSLALVAQALAPSLPALLVARTLHGVFSAAAAPLIVALVAAATPEAIRASVLNLSSFPFYLGSITGGALGGLVAARSLQAVFLLSAGGTLLASGVLARLRAAGRLGQASDATGAGG